VVTTARQTEQITDLIDAYGDRVCATALDVTDPQAAREAVALTTGVFGRLDVVANPPATPTALRSRRRTRATSAPRSRRSCSASSTSRDRRFRCSAGSGPACLWQFSSVGGRVGGTPGRAPTRPKFAVEGFAEVLANEVAPFGVKVLIVEPGAFGTDWQGASTQHTTSVPTTPRPSATCTACATGPTAPNTATRPVPRRSSSTSPAATPRRAGCCSAPTR
jgi:NAD(P)-dependent dehydrogenase (short-subunit alcohol dehydrogenase family)